MTTLLANAQLFIYLPTFCIFCREDNEKTWNSFDATQKESFIKLIKTESTPLFKTFFQLK